MGNGVWSLILAIILATTKVNMVNYGTIREPTSHSADQIAKVAVQCCATAYPEDSLRDSGWETGNQNAHWDKTNDARLYYYYRLMDEFITRPGGNNAYSSCHQFTATVLAATVDKNAWEGSFSGEALYTYLNSKPYLYKNLGHIDFSQLRPGDIFIAPEHHSGIFVGKAAQAKFPGTLGNVAQAGWTTHSYPAVDMCWRIGRQTLGELTDWNTEYIVFRPR